MKSIGLDSEDYARINFMATLMRGHADAAWAMLEMGMILNGRRVGGIARGTVDARLARASRKLKSAADHLEKARGRQP